MSNQSQVQTTPKWDLLLARSEAIFSLLLVSHGSSPLMIDNKLY